MEKRQGNVRFCKNRGQNATSEVLREVVDKYEYEEASGFGHPVPREFCGLISNFVLWKTLL